MLAVLSPLLAPAAAHSAPLPPSDDSPMRACRIGNLL
jgi:hypothetical protein